MRTILPLTEYERQLAEQCHEMVYIYLKKHYYDIEEYYDIAVMGLLAGVQQWNRNEGIKEKYAISTICSRNIHGAIATHFRDENRQKRKPSGGYISIDKNFDEGNDTFINCIITPSLEDEFFAKYDNLEETDNARKMEVLMKKINHLKLSSRQMDVINLLIIGHKFSEMDKELGISKQAVYQMVKKIRKKAEEAR